MATETVTARQGDTLDGLIWRERRLGPIDLAEVLQLNPGLAALGDVLPIGTVVIVPASQQDSTTPVLPLIQLWS